MRVALMGPCMALMEDKSTDCNLGVGATFRTSIREVRVQNQDSDPHEPL